MAVKNSIDLIRDELRVGLAGSLYCDVSDIHDDATFADQGMDSILVVEFISEINLRYQLKESVQALYDNPTLNQFSAYLHRVLETRAADRI